MSFRYTWVLAILFLQLIFWVYFIIKRQKQPPGLFSSEMDKILARDLNTSKVTLKNNILIIGSICNLGFIISAFKVGYKQAWKDEFGNEDDNNL